MRASEVVRLTVIVKIVVPGRDQVPGRDHRLFVPVFDYQQFKVDSLKHQFDVVFDTAGTLTIKESRAQLKPNGVVLGINPSPDKLFGIMLSGRHKLVRTEQS